MKTGTAPASLALPSLMLGVPGFSYSAGLKPGVKEANVAAGNGLKPVVSVFYRAKKLWFRQKN